MPSVPFCTGQPDSGLALLATFAAFKSATRMSANHPLRTFSGRCPKSTNEVEEALGEQVVEETEMTTGGGVAIGFLVLMVVLVLRGIRGQERRLGDPEEPNPDAFSGADHPD